MLAPVIESRDLTYAYAGGPRLGFPDLHVPGGGVLLVRGASGSGKSTLLALLAGLLRPTAGALAVAGTDLTRLSAPALDAWRARALGVMPQRLHLSASLTVAANLALPYVCAGAAPDAARVRSLAAQLGLQDLLSRRPHQLSVGQAQRVALARALVRAPAVLMADEPTASLDDAHAADVAALLLDAAGASGATLVLATHDRRLIDAAGHRAGGTLKAVVL